MKQPGRFDGTGVTPVSTSLSAPYVKTLTLPVQTLRQGPCDHVIRSRGSAGKRLAATEEADPAGRFRTVSCEPCEELDVRVYSVIPFHLSGDHLHPFSSIFTSDMEKKKRKKKTDPRAKLLKFLFDSS